MPSLVRTLIDPSVRKPGPGPLPVNLFHVVLVGLGVWFVAGIVTTVLWMANMADAGHVWVCVAGVVLGAAGCLWTRGRQRRYQDIEQLNASFGPHQDDPQPDVPHHQDGSPQI